MNFVKNQETSHIFLSKDKIRNPDQVLAGDRCGTSDSQMKRHGGSCLMCS